ncbi:IclR family transcriptional regulator [Litorihabitans aurantiacus]|uniref:Glycerol operon regulatory protein n=1 Tax=Litorihabitans aurantiacus TaxID=1930061 RepID=A0AA37UWB6_9MICO|nr:IclR family transcriptional regulator [Litorihabitans aurantiacus]GMA30292.1 transcriptional regulator [Litorihabitans aurantiacus]
MTEASPVESIDRALLALTELAAAGADGLSLAVLADRVGVHKTTLHRALTALRFRGFVAQDPDGGAYRLGATALTLGDGYLAEQSLASALHPALVAISRELGELVHLGTLVGTHVVYLDKVEPERPLRVWSAVGRRMPAATTALGRALLAGRAPTRESLDSYLDPGADPDARGRTWDAVAAARTTGYAQEREENEPGIACVAVALLRGANAVAAVSVTVPAERLDGERLPAVVATVRRVLGELAPPASCSRRLTSRRPSARGRATR